MSDEEEEFKEASDVAMTTELRPFPVFRSQDLASSMGVDTHTVQVMKASFFGGADEAKKPFSLKSSRPLLFKTTPTPASLTKDHSLLHHSGRYTPLSSLPSRLHHGRGGSAPPTSLTPPPERFPHPAVSSLQAQASVIMAKHNLSLLPPLERSALRDKTHSIADAGLSMGRSFRVGWGPNWTLVHSGFPLSRSSQSSSLGLFSTAASGGSTLIGVGEGIPLTASMEQVHAVTSEPPHNTVSEGIY